MRCLMSLIDMLILDVLVEIVKTVDSVIADLKFWPTTFLLEHTNKVSNRKSFEIRIAERRPKNYGELRHSEEPL